MNCQVIINTQSGRADRLDVKKILERHTNFDDQITVSYLRNVEDWTDNCHKVIVCGGDGTLYSALNKYAIKPDTHLVYVACGTLNENACFKKNLTDVGLVNDKLVFSYVMATGVFTSIGYDCTTEDKQKHKKLAYWKKALLSYEITPQDICVVPPHWTWHKPTALMMLLRSDRCFGFRFNKMYKDNTTYILLVSAKGPLKTTTLPKLFRCFFMGFDKPYFTEDIVFAPIDSATLNVPSNTEFCIDGEKVSFGNNTTVKISSKHLYNAVTIDYGCLH